MPQETRTSVCVCGKQMNTAFDRCSSCVQARQQQSSPQKFALPYRTGKSMPLPPNQINMPVRPTESPSILSSSPRSYTNAAVPSPFNIESGSAAFSPASMYRNSDARSASRSASIASRSSSITPSSISASDSASPLYDRSGRKDSRSATPDPARTLAAEGYAPMAAGFARLRIKDEQTAAARRGRGGNIRPSLELEARMFSGPA